MWHVWRTVPVLVILSVGPVIPSRLFVNLNIIQNVSSGATGYFLGNIGFTVQAPSLDILFSGQLFPLPETPRDVNGIALLVDH